MRQYIVRFVPLILTALAAHSTSSAKEGNFQVPGYAPIYEEIETNYYFGRTYVLFKSAGSKLNWMQSHIKCRTHGMELVSFETRGEFDFLWELIQKSGIMEHHTQPGGYSAAWISAHDLFSEGNFSYLYSGRPFSAFYNSDPYQPDNTNGIEHCLELRMHRSENGSILLRINDITCHTVSTTICKI